jgi:hypothetical protein
MTKPKFRQATLPVSGVLGSLPVETYRLLVDQCAMHRFNYPIANGSPIHARILIAKLFEIAESEVVIVSGCLTHKSETGHDVYGHEPVVNAAKKFLSDPNAQLSIILQQGEMQDGDDNRFFHSVVNDPKRCGILTITTPPKGTLGTEIPHFMIADRASYRLETGSEAINKKTDTMTAVANFGDQVTAADLRGYFDEVIDFISSENFDSGKSYGPEVRVE